LLAFMLTLTSRLLGTVVGSASMIAGALLIVTVIAAPVGVPLAIFGLALMLRGMF
jgi:hypothetical protein